MIFEYLNMDLKKLMDKKKDVFTPQLIKVSTLVCSPLKYFHIATLQSYMHQILDAVGFCHTNRILHRDLKPQNLLVDTAGKIKVRLKVLPAVGSVIITNSNSSWLTLA